MRCTMSAGCTVRVPGVQQIPKEASLWAMSRQDPERQCSVPTLQQRHVARKVARAGAQPAQAPQPLLGLRPLEACASGLEVSATSMSASEHSLPQAEPDTAPDLGRDVQLPPSDPARRCILQGTDCADTAERARLRETAPCPKKTGLAQRKANSNRALRVQSLRQELVAAEAVVQELKSWLADAEAELKEERANSI